MAIKPTTKNLTIYQGDTFNETDENFELLQSAGVPLDLTGWTISAQIRRKASSTSSMADFTVVEDDAANGLFHLELLPADTAAISAGTYLWDCQCLNDSTGEVRTVFSGQVEVLAEVTR